MVAPKPRGQFLTEPIYDAVVQALKDDDHTKLDLLVKILHPADAADLLERLSPAQRLQTYAFIAEDKRGDVISNLQPEVQQSLLRDMPSDQVAEIIAHLASDDITDIVHNLGDEQAAQTLRDLDEYTESSPDLLRYEDDTAGGIMRVEYLAAQDDWTVQDFIDHIRQNPEDLPEDISKGFVMGTEGYLVGTVTLAHMLRFPNHKRLVDIMRTKPITVTPDMHQSEVAKIFEKYDLNTCAVVDFRGRMLGCITVDDILDVVIEESHSEMLRSSGVQEEEDLFAPVKVVTRNRLPWLIINLATAVLASIVIGFFGASIEQLVALAVLMPIVASMGGNAAGQVIAVTIRALAMKQITQKNAQQVIWKEIAVGSLNGAILGIMLAVGTVAIYDSWGLAFVIFAACLINHVAAGVSGYLVPVIMDRRGIDPALSSSIWVTTVTDVVGFISFLGLATIFLL